MFGRRRKVDDFRLCTRSATPPSSKTTLLNGSERSLGKSVQCLINAYRTYGSQSNGILGRYSSIAAQPY
jgi:hypothetical protein